MATAFVIEHSPGLAWADGIAALVLGRPSLDDADGGHVGMAIVRAASLVPSAAVNNVLKHHN